MTEVLVAQRWRDNAELIQAVFEMHVFPRCPEPEVLDCTYSKGTWWKNWWGRPTGDDRLTKHDLKLDGVDYRKLPEPDNTFDVVAFDPDYIAPGGRKTSTIDEFNESYGLKAEYETPGSLQFQINDGLYECKRVTKPGGLILVKCMNYVTSGRLHLGEYHTLSHGLNIDLRVVDIFRPIMGTGPQPKDRKCGKCKGSGVIADHENSAIECPRCDGTGRLVPRQQHARANTSTLIVFRKMGRRVHHGDSSRG